jgi:hypothetical protein
MVINNMDMEYKDFYVISDKDSRGTLTLLPSLNLDYFKLFKGESNVDEPLVFQKNYGNKLFDLLFSGVAGLYLLNERVISIIEGSQITGWKTYSCKIEPSGNTNYLVFATVGRCGAIDYSKSEIFMKQPFTPTGKAVEAKRGLYFDLNSWDGSDVFTPDNSKFIFITEKVKKLFVKNKVTNITFENITQFELI